MAENHWCEDEEHEFYLQAILLLHTTRRLSRHRLCPHPSVYDLTDVQHHARLYSASPLHSDPSNLASQPTGRLPLFPSHARIHLHLRPRHYAFTCLPTLPARPSIVHELLHSLSSETFCLQTIEADRSSSPLLNIHARPAKSFHRTLLVQRDTIIGDSWRVDLR